MINNIKRFFETHLQLADNKGSIDVEHRLKLTSAALMLEIIQADGEIQDEEQNQIRKLLQQQHELSNKDIEELIELAHHERNDATDYYQFASLINQHYSQAQKIQLIEQFWLLAYADKKIDRYEEHLVRKLAELLHVPHSAFIQSKHRAARSTG